MFIALRNMTSMTVVDIDLVLARLLLPNNKNDDDDDSNNGYANIPKIFANNIFLARSRLAVHIMMRCSAASNKCDGHFGLLSSSS